MLTGPLRHRTFEYSQENSQLGYLSLRMGELRIFSALTTFSDLHVTFSHSQSQIFIQLSQIEENIYKI
jgi:hypothetical protein